MFQKITSLFKNQQGRGIHSRLLKNNYQKTSKAIAFLFCVIFFVFLPVGFSGVSKAEAATYYVNSNCSSDCDGSSSDKGWSRLIYASNASSVPSGSTVEIVAGSGPYYEMFIPDVNQKNITWNFNNTQVRGDVNVNQLVTNGTYVWQSSANVNHLGYYYLKSANPNSINLVANGTMETDNYWSNYATVSTNERSHFQAHSGNYSRHVIANVGGIGQNISGLQVGTKYRVSGWYYLVGASALRINFFANQTPDLLTRGSWQHFSYDVTATATSTGLNLYYPGSVEFYVDDVRLEQLDGSNNIVTNTYNPWTTLFSGSNTVLSAVVDGTWNASATKNWTTNKWDWGDFDSVGYNTLYVKWTGGNPTGNNVQILAAIQDYDAIVNAGSSGHIINKAQFIGANGYNISLSEAVIFNKDVFQYADSHGIDIGTSAGGNLSGTTIQNSKFIDCGHRGINITLPVNTLNVYNNYFYGTHLMLRNDGVNSSVINFRNNSNYTALAGSVQWTNNASTLNENNNQFHVDANSQHGSKQIGFLASGTNNWTLSGSSDIPGSFDVTSVCDSSHPQNCGINPIVDSNGNPLYNSSLIDTGVVITGRTSDILGNHIYGTPDIGAYEYQPPYTITTDNPNISSPIRIYADGKYRYTNTTSGSNTAKLSITPQAGFGTGDYSEWMDVSIDTWHTATDYYKKWTESSTNPTLITTHTIGDLESDTYYTLKIDTTNQNTYLSNSTGQITFIYSGGYSTHTFEITEDTTSPASFTLVSPTSNTVTSNRTPTFSWNASSDTESDLSKYQLYIDRVMDVNNIASSASSTFPSAELSCGNHSWYIKAIDNNNNTTNSNIFNLDINCSGGFISPTKPIVTPTDPALGTVPSNITQIAISKTPDFTNISWQPFDPNKFKNIDQTTETLYVKFRTDQGAVSDTIIYEAKPSIINSNPTIIPLNEGDIVKTLNNPDVYVIKYKNNKQYKRLILSPLVFKSYQHLKWENIKIISQEQLDKYTTSNLVKETIDTIIYQLFPNGDTGERKAQDTSIDYDSDSVYEINKTDRDSYVLAK